MPTGPSVFVYEGLVVFVLHFALVTFCYCCACAILYARAVFVILLFMYVKPDVFAPSVLCFPITLTFRDWEGFWFEGGRSCDCPRCRYIRYVVLATHLLPREV